MMEKSVLDLKFNNRLIEEKLTIFKIISAYYLDGINALNREALDSIAFIMSSDNQVLREVFADLKNNSEEGIQVKYDYNKLYVGPASLLAPPYESVYSSNNKIMMQRETLEVRDFYRQLGLACVDEGRIPDDHLGLEMEFLAFLLYSILQTDEKDRDEQISIYYNFMDKHLSGWGLRHSQDVITNSKTNTCRAIGRLLEEVLKEEKIATEEYYKGIEVGKNNISKLEGSELGERTIEVI